MEALAKPGANKQHSTPVWKRAFRAQYAIQGDECLLIPALLKLARFPFKDKSETLSSNMSVSCLTITKI